MKAALLALALLLPSTCEAGRRRDQRHEKRIAKITAQPAKIQARNEGGRPFGWGVYYSGRAAFNASGIPQQIIGGIIGGLVR